MNYIYEYGNRLLIAHGISLIILLIFSYLKPGWQILRKQYLHFTAWIALLAAGFFLLLDLYPLLLYSGSNDIFWEYRREQWWSAAITAVLIPGFIISQGWYLKISGALLAAVSCNVVALREVVMLLYPVYYRDLYQTASWLIRRPDAQIHFLYTQVIFTLFYGLSLRTWIKSGNSRTIKNQLP